MDRGPGGVGEGFAEALAAEAALAVAVELAETFYFDDDVRHGWVKGKGLWSADFADTRRLGLGRARNQPQRNPVGFRRQRSAREGRTGKSRLCTFDFGLWTRGGGHCALARPMTGGLRRWSQAPVEGIGPASTEGRMSSLVAAVASKATRWTCSLTPRTSSAGT